MHQLLGEMGNKYQRDDETVISFANSIQDIGRRIIEIQRVNVGNIDIGFRTSIENNLVECFKRRLKPEVEQRLENADDMEHIVQNATKAERSVEAKKALRKENKNKTKATPQSRKFRKGTFLSDFHETGGQNIEMRASSSLPFITCQFCDKPGHSASKCRKRHCK